MSDTQIGSGVQLEETPPFHTTSQSMDDARRELDAAVLQAKKHCLEYGTQQESGQEAHIKRYLYAVTVMRNDRFFSLHSARRSRSLTRVYVEQREDRERSPHPSLPKKTDFAEEEIEDRTIRLEWHETIEGRRADVVEEDRKAIGELQSHLPVEYHQWEHDVQVQSEDSATTWRVGDHLFSYEEPFDLSVELPDKVHYFFTGEHLPERRRRYNSLPNLSTVGLDSSLLSQDHSHHSLYGHGFRHIGNTFLSRTMDGLDENRLQMGARPSLHEGIYSTIPIVVFERGSRQSLHNIHAQSHTTGHEGHYAVSEVEYRVEQTPSTSLVDHYAEPEITSTVEHVNESTIVEPPSPEHQHTAESFTTKFAADLAHVEEVIKEAVTHQKHQEEPIYDHVYEERIYDNVAHEVHDAAPPIPTSPMPTDTLHYAAIAVATGDDDDAHLYKDDENIYEEIDAHVIDSTGYAEPHVYDVPSEKKAEKEHEYAEVAREEHTQRATESVEQFSSLRNKFESQEGTENYYEKVTAPRRKDYDYDENGNHDEVLIRTPEFSESTSSRGVLRNVKPYVGSPTFNKLQKKFFPEDLAKRQAQRDREEVVDPAVLHSPTTIHINDGQIETEYRAYDKNHYDDSTATLVMATPLDEVAARRTMTIRRMSRNNRWSEDEPESPRIRTHNLDEIIPPNSPFVKVPSPLASPRSPSISPVPPRSQISPAPRPSSISPVAPASPHPTENNNDAKFTRPEELNFRTKHDVPKDPITPVERVVSSEVTTPRSPVELYEFGSVKERRKMFENGSAPPLPGYTSTRMIGTGAKPYTRAPATVRLETIRDSPVQVPEKSPEPVYSPIEVKLRKTIKEEVPVSQKQEMDPSRRKSVLEMRKEYEASLQGSQPSTTTTSPQRSRTNSRRRTGEVQIGAGVALDTQPKNTDEQSSVARRTVHRTIDIPMHQEASPSSVTIGHGATVSKNEDYRRHETSSYSTRVTIGKGAEVRSSPVPAARVSAGAVPTSVPPVEPSLPEGTSLTVDFDLVTAKPAQIEDVPRESTAIVEEEPTPLQRNGSGRRSWTVKTYENNIRFDNQKLKMPDVDYATTNGHIPNGIEKMNGEENAVLKEWDPRPLVRNLYEVSYEPRVETKRNRFFTMEGHVEVPSQETNTLAELEREWKSQYMRTKEGRLQIFASHCSTDAPAEEIILSGCDVDANRDERTLTIHGGKDKIRMLLRVPSNVFDKWRQALLSHAASSQIDAYVKPVHRTMDHLSERVIIIEIGSCSIRGGRLTQEPSLPQSFFPAIGVRTEDGRIIVGEDAYTPQVRHQGEFVRPIQASDPAVERYTMDKEVVKACMSKVVTDLQIDPRKYKVLLSIPQNIPIVLISELVTIALQEIKFQGAAITRQPSLILYAYDVTTGVVVDIGDRLNIVPVIDGYVVDSAICSIPYGATQVREALRSDLCAHNKGLYSFQSPIEKLILRYVMEQVCYVPEDYANEEKSRNKDVHVSLDEFNPTPGMPTKFNIDNSRFTCTEGLFRPKKWGLDTKGLHQLVHEAVQMSPIDARRILYRNIYLAGGASLLPGLAEKLEQELANIVPNTIHTQVHISPWRYNAAFLGAQVVASSSTFEDQCVTGENLQKFLFDLSTSTF